VLARPPVGDAAAPVAASGRRAAARLEFVRAGGRTVLARQHVPYPIHITRTFLLDPARPELSTLYLQSASGGLYRGDDVELEIMAAAGAAVHVTTQAATVVHDCRGATARQAVRLDAGEASFVAFTPDPLVLFPGAALAASVDLRLASGATAILVDGVCRHAPAGAGGVFERYESAVSVFDAAGRLVVCDRGAVAGGDLAGAASPLGPWSAFGNAWLLGPADRLPDPGRVEAAAANAGCLAGAGAAPNAAGLAVRLLAADGGALSRGLAAVFAVAFEAMLGVPPARRRK
jgi:urease accessory protein